MADTHASEASPGVSYPQSRSGYARSSSRTQHPASDAGGRARAQWRDDQEEYGSRTLSNPVDDLVPVLGMFIGGAVGFVLATMIPSAQTRSNRSSGWRAFGAGSEGRSTRRADASGSVEHDETTDLIASSKVEGTAVYNRQGERLGDVYNFMVGKRSGRVAYAVMSFGGFLGIGKRYHALPWSMLTYDTKRGGYVIDADKERLMAAPHFAEGEDPFSRSENMQRIRDYWSSGRLAL
jgi:PRC-barrel domain